MKLRALVTVLAVVLASFCFAQGTKPHGSIEQNKSIAKQVIAVFNERDFAAVDNLIAEDFVNHAIPGRPNGDSPAGREGVKGVIKHIESAFPDFKMEILDLIAEGVRVAFRTLITGTHNGSFMGIAPTGRKVSFEAMHFLQISNGKVAEHWSVRDDLRRLRQIGQFPSLRENSFQK